MSFSLAEEDTMATLEELVAFVDCSNESVQGNQDPLVLDELISSSAKEQCSQLKGATSKKTSKRRRIRIGWSSSTGLQRRKRAELLFLQQHVRDLEIYLQQLKSPCIPAFDCITPETPTWWKEIAGTQLAERLKSEQINRALKTMLNNQLLVHDALRNIFAQTGDETLLQDQNVDGAHAA